MKILIADDHELLRDTLDAYLAAQEDFDVYLAADLDAALGMVTKCGPFDIILLDFSMPGMNGFIGLERMLCAARPAPVAIMSGTASREIGERAIFAGASGFLPKSLPAKSLTNAIRFMAAGERYLPMDERQLSQSKIERGPFADLLTARELQVLNHLCESLPNKEIARRLLLREPTVKLHVKQLCRKLKARNRTHAAMLARDAGFC